MKQIKNKLKNKLVLGFLALMFLGASTLGVVEIYAQSSQGTYPSIVQRLADRFHLNADDVKAVFDQNHQDKMGQRQQKLEDRLSQAVKDGKITEDQKQKILAKIKDLQANQQAFRDSLKNMTPDQRKAALQKQRDELNAWAQQNGIDPKNLFLGRGFGFRGHMGFWK